MSPSSPQPPDTSPLPSPPNEQLLDLIQHPTFSSLFSSPHHTPLTTLSRSPPSTHPLPHSFTLYNTTLATTTTFRAVQSFSLRACPHHNLSRDEWLVLHSLGTGLNGPRAIVHGGILMTMMDSAMAFTALRAAGGLQRVASGGVKGVGDKQKGECTACKGREEGKRQAGSLKGMKVVPIATVGFRAEFIRRVKAPCVVLVRAWAVEIEEFTGEGDDGERSAKRKLRGERIKIRVTSLLEDGGGGAHVRAHADFVAGGGAEGRDDAKRAARL